MAEVYGATTNVYEAIAEDGLVCLGPDWTPSGSADGSLNLERVQLTPLFTHDDDFLQALPSGDVDPVTGLLADPTPPFALYPPTSTTSDHSATRSKSSPEEADGCPSSSLRTLFP